MSLPETYALTELERATGLVIEADRDAPPLPVPPRELTPRAALEDSIRSALQRPPCLVSFSGGRDSSAVLAVGAEIARREGLPAPVAVTYRYPAGMADADESRWQELVIGHSRVDDWVRIELTDEMDCLGPIGVETLRRHGLLFPFAVHSLVPGLRMCRGGSLLTGIGGDQILGRRSRLADVLARRVRPVPRDAARLALAAGPRSIRRSRARSHAPSFVDWLTPHGREAFARSWGELWASIPARWGTGLGRAWRSRDLRVAVAAMEVLANEHEVRLLHPFVDPLFVAALARDGGVRGYAGRTAVMRMLFGDVLPDALNDRRSKAAFGQPYWTHYSQEFARGWDGHGLDTDLVDVDVLRAHWAGAKPPPAPSLVLLKQAWLAAAGRASGRVERVDEQGSGAVELRPAPRTA